MVVGFSGSLDEDPDADEEEEEDEEAGALEDCEVFGELVDEGADAVVDAELDDDDEPESSLPSLRDFNTPSRNPLFAYACATSHIMTPPKLSNLREYSITSASLSAGMYPVLAASGPAGTPTMTLTSLFLETVLAQLSHSSKLYCELLESLLKALTPQ